MLKFSVANAKTKRLYQIPALAEYLDGGRKVYSFDLLSGWTCPGAKDCHSKVVESHGKRTIQDGKHCEFRCFSASQEVVFPNVYNARLHNTQAIKSMSGHNQIRSRLALDLPKDCGILRWHVAGDFFKFAYLQAAYQLAQLRTDVLFYGYTKSLHLLRKLDVIQPEEGMILPNFLITASRGGKYDDLINEIGLREAKVVFDESETDLEIDHDDSHAATTGGDFALLLHGTQPKGTAAANALRALRQRKVGSYARK